MRSDADLKVSQRHPLHLDVKIAVGVPEGVFGLTGIYYTCNPPERRPASCLFCRVCCIMELELRNVELRAGNELHVEGTVLEDAERFQIDLGSDPEDLSLHFNPRFHDDTDGRVIVCNSKCEGCWGVEQRDMSNPFHRGEKVKVTVKLRDSGFEVELPEGREIHFPDRRGQDTVTYVRVRGHMKLGSFAIH
ncbi:hypothetical protein GJAV_G00223240 [Gymnothorax javanicus]|nr:hypothetical protein GJAV_G00223240 [Gymnothorax javanicus]